MKKFFILVATVTQLVSASVHMVDPRYLRKARTVESVAAINLSVAAPRAVITVNDCRDVALYHEESGFSVHSGASLYRIQQHDMDIVARKIDKRNLLAFLSSGGRIHVSPASDGSFLVRTSVGAKGGGPILGEIMYASTFVASFTIPAITFVSGVRRAWSLQVSPRHIASAFRVAASQHDYARHLVHSAWSDMSPAAREAVIVAANEIKRVFLEALRDPLSGVPISLTSGLGLLYGFGKFTDFMQAKFDQHVARVTPLANRARAIGNSITTI